MSDQWTERVRARADLANVLLERHEDRARAAGLLRADLEAIRDHGRKAERADREQQEELASIAAERLGRKIEARELMEREEQLRVRIPAVIADLEAASDPLARFLAKLSFARYRFRDITPEPPRDDAEASAVRAVERVERTDKVTRFAGLAAYCDALLAPGREAIVARLEARGLSADAIRALSADASAYVAAGENKRRAASATAVEAEAVAAQKKVWSDVRRMIRNAVKGVPELEAKYAEC